MRVEWNFSLLVSRRAEIDDENSVSRAKFRLVENRLNLELASARARSSY